MTETHVILAVACHIPLGEGDYLLAVNAPDGRPDTPFLSPITAALPAESSLIKKLMQLGAHNFASNGLSFEVKPDKVTGVRNWFVTGHDRSPNSMAVVLQHRLPGIEFGQIDLAGLVRTTTSNAQGQKVVILTETYTAWLSAHGRQSIENWLLGGFTLVTRVCEQEIKDGLTVYGSAIDPLAAQMLNPPLKY